MDASAATTAIHTAVNSPSITAFNSPTITAVHSRRNSFHYEKGIEETLVGVPADIAKDLEKGLKEAIIQNAALAAAAAAHTEVEEPAEHPWLVLIACSVIVAITQGWGFVFGVFQPWFKQHILSSTMSDSLLVLLPTTQAMAFMLTCSISGRLADRFGPKPFIFLGCLASVISVLGCAFGYHLRQLFVSQAAQGIGAGLVFPPCGAIVTRSWRIRPYFANSVVAAAVPAYAFVAILVARAMLSLVGHHTTLLIVCGVHAAVLLPCLVAIFFAPGPKRTESITWFDATLVRDRRFWCLATSIAVTAFALLLPFVFITVYTVDTIPQIAPQVSVLPLATVNLFACLGRAAASTLIGLADKEEIRGVRARRTFLVVIFLSALSQLIWAFARTLPGILMYAAVNGFVGGTCLTLLPCLVPALFPELNKTVGVGSLTIFAAPGCFFGAFIFNKVLHSTHFTWQMSIFGAGIFQLLGAFFALFI